MKPNDSSHQSSEKSLRKAFAVVNRWNPTHEALWDPSHKKNFEGFLHLVQWFISSLAFHLSINLQHITVDTTFISSSQSSHTLHRLVWGKHHWHPRKRKLTLGFCPSWWWLFPNFQYCQERTLYLQACVLVPLLRATWTVVEKSTELIDLWKKKGKKDHLSYNGFTSKCVSWSYLTQALSMHKQYFHVLFVLLYRHFFFSFSISSHILCTTEKKEKKQSTSDQTRSLKTFDKIPVGYADLLLWIYAPTCEGMEIEKDDVATSYL